MSEWKVRKLSEVADIVGGGTPSSSKNEYFDNGKIAWLTPKDLSGYKFRYISKGERNITDLGLKNSSAKLLPKGTVLLTSRAPIGYVAIAKNEISTNQGFKSLVLKEGHIPEFYYYLLKYNVPLLEARSTGSTFKEISGQILKDTELNIPTTDIQQKIVDILMPLDEKIELNTQLNQTLEQIAQATFKSWFIDFDPVRAKAAALANGQSTAYQQLTELAEAFPSELVEIDGVEVPRGWEVAQLADQFEFIGGSQPPKSEHIYELQDGYERFIQNRDYSNDNHRTYIKISKRNKRCDEKDILMDKYGEAGKVRFGIQGAYNVALAKIEPKKDNMREFLRGYFQQKNVQTYLQSSSVASTRNSLNSSTFTGMEVILPSNELLNYFEENISIYIDKCLQIKTENKSLAETRDLLLPRLLNGEI